MDARRGGGGGGVVMGKLAGPEERGDVRSGDGLASLFFVSMCSLSTCSFSACSLSSCSISTCSLSSCSLSLLFSHYSSLSLYLLSLLSLIMFFFLFLSCLDSCRFICHLVVSLPLLCTYICVSTLNHAINPFPLSCPRANEA